jgi:GNAT superfamily N-acetyltransferase
MYVVESWRGRGLAARLLAVLEANACKAGADAMILETGRPQTSAIGLYRARGYADIAHFGHYASAPLAVHLGKRLAPG